MSSIRGEASNCPALTCSGRYTTVTKDQLITELNFRAEISKDIALRLQPAKDRLSAGAASP